MDDAERQRALLEAAEEIAEVGSWEWQPETDELVWSRNLFRILGLDPDTTTPTLDLVAALTHPDDLERREREVERLRAGADEQRFDFRIIHPDGSIRKLHSTIVVVEGNSGSPRRVLGCVQDLTSLRGGGREIAAHLAASECLANWSLPGHGAAGLLRSLGAALDCSFAILWVADEGELFPHTTWVSAALSAEESERAQEQLEDARAARPASDALSAAAPVIHNAAAFGGTASRIESLGFAGSVAFPVIAGNQVLAVLEFLALQPIEVSDRFVRSLLGIGHELGAFLAHHRTELRPSSITARELEVLRRAADGASGPQIAAELQISPATVKSHFQHIYEKLGVSDRASAVAAGLRDGLIQ